VSITKIEAELRHRARELIHQGLLPRTSSLDTWGGPAKAQLCSLCKQPIDRDDLEMKSKIGSRRTFESIAFISRATPPGSLNAPIKST
jgi:hypothetical protein